LIGYKENSLLTNAFGRTDLWVINEFNCRWTWVTNLTEATSLGCVRLRFDQYIWVNIKSSCHHPCRSYALNGSITGIKRVSQGFLTGRIYYIFFGSFWKGSLLVYNKSFPIEFYDSNSSVFDIFEPEIFEWGHKLKNYNWRIWPKKSFEHYLRSSSPSFASNFAKLSDWEFNRRFWKLKEFFLMLYCLS
jgi:hypothetical protein